MLNLDQWKEDANARKELEDLFRHPTLANALEIVKQQGLAPINPPAGVDIVQFGAMMGFKRDGYFEAIANLKLLAKVTPRKSSDPKPWKVDPKSIPEEKFIDPPANKLPLPLTPEPKKEPELN